MLVKVLGIDIAKNVFQLHGVDELGKVSLKKRLQRKNLLEEDGIKVVGPTNHGFCESIYFFDPNGHRTELTYHLGDAAMMQKLKSTAPLMLEKWNKEKVVPTDAAWIHENKV